MQATINLSVPTTIAAFDDGPECHSGVDGIRREIGWAWVGLLRWPGVIRSGEMGRSLSWRYLGGESQVQNNCIGCELLGE
jgi:hypothetical protein